MTTGTTVSYALVGTLNGSGVHDIKQTGIPEGYSKYHGEDNYDTVLKSKLGNDIDPPLNPGTPDYLRYGYEVVQPSLVHNRTGWIVANHFAGVDSTNAGSYDMAKGFWRIDRPLPPDASGKPVYAKTKFWPVKIITGGSPAGLTPATGDLFGGPFAAITDMKLADCGSNPLVIEKQKFSYSSPNPQNLGALVYRRANSSYSNRSVDWTDSSGTAAQYGDIVRTTGFVWEEATAGVGATGGNPAVPAVPAHWETFTLTKPDGNPIPYDLGDTYNLENPHQELLSNERGELLNQFGLWRNGRFTPMADLLPGPDPGAPTPLIPTGLNKSGVISVFYRTTDPEVQAGLLLPVEFEIKRGGIGNNTDNVPTLPTWRSQSGNVRDLVSVWDAHTTSTLPADLRGDWMQARITIGGLNPASLPANFIVWSIDGHPAPAGNTLETPRLSWPGSFGVKTVQVTVGSKVYKVKVDVPNVGTTGHVGWGIQMTARFGIVGGPAGALLAKGYGTDAITWSAAYPAKASLRNALQHSSWIASCASQNAIGPVMALLLGYAHENDNFTSGNNWAYESTMDIHNNTQGALSVHSTFFGNPDTAAIQADVIGKLAAGDLRIWDSPLLEHSGFKATMKSNDAPVYP